MTVGPGIPRYPQAGSKGNGWWGRWVGTAREMVARRVGFLKAVRAPFVRAHFVRTPFVPIFGRIDAMQVKTYKIYKNIENMVGLLYAASPSLTTSGPRANFIQLYKILGSSWACLLTMLCVILKWSWNFIVCWHGHRTNRRT